MTALRRTPGLVFLLGSLTAFAPMSIDMYLPALRQLQRDLATDAASVQLTLASFFAAFALGQLFTVRSPTASAANHRCMPG